MATRRIRYLTTNCSKQAHSSQSDNNCRNCPLNKGTLRASHGWDMRLDTQGGVVACRRDAGPIIYLPPACYACAWEMEP